MPDKIQRELSPSPRQTLQLFRPGYKCSQPVERQLRSSGWSWLDSGSAGKGQEDVGNALSSPSADRIQVIGHRREGTRPLPPEPHRLSQWSLHKWCGSSTADKEKKPGFGHRCHLGCIRFKPLIRPGEFGLVSEPSKIANAAGKPLDLPRSDGGRSGAEGIVRLSAAFHISSSLSSAVVANGARLK